jgi:hypothetical protein
MRIGSRRPDLYPEVPCKADAGRGHVSPATCVTLAARTRLRAKGLMSIMHDINGNLSNADTRDGWLVRPPYRESAIREVAVAWNRKDDVDGLCGRDGGTLSGAPARTCRGAEGDRDCLSRCLQTPDIFESYDQAAGATAAVVGRIAAGTCDWNDPDCRAGLGFGALYFGAGATRRNGWSLYSLCQRPRGCDEHAKQRIRYELHFKLLSNASPHRAKRRRTPWGRSVRDYLCCHSIIH